MSGIETYSYDEFLLDGVSCTVAGLYCDVPPVPPMAKKRFTAFKYGNDEDGVFSDDSYENIKITLNCFKFPLARGNYSDTDLYAWIQSAKRLQISRYPEYYFKIRMIDGITPVQSYDGAKIAYKITFTCSPFKYFVSNPEFELPQDGVIENEGTRYSKPIIRFKMDPSDATITCNGVPFYINQSGNNVPITIDSDRMLVYKTVNGENISIMEHTQGKLPMFSVGTNVLQVSSNVSNVTITGNWRCY